MVVLCVIFSSEQIADHKEDVICVPLSLVMIAGTPKRAIHPRKMEEAHSAHRISSDSCRSIFKC